MAIVANTFQTTGSTTNREEMHDVVSRITPEDTPIYSMISKETFKTTHPEWVVDELAAPGANVQLEGDTYDFDATTPPVRVGNYTQIMRKTGIISRSEDKNDQAGQVLTRKHQKLKKGVELRKDVEFSIVDSNPSVGGTTRESGSLATWIETNANRGAGGANGGFAAGFTTAPTDGAQRAFDKDSLDNVMQQGYENGANFKHVFVSPYVKSVFVTFMSDTNVASFRYAAQNGDQNSIVANADVYEGPFGKVMIQPNRVMGGAAALARNAFLVDPEYLSFGWFDKIKEDKEAAKVKTSDAHRFVLIGEGALKTKNERGLGVIADVFGMSATA